MLANDTDPDGDPLTLASPPSRPTAPPSVIDGKVTLHPRQPAGSAPTPSATPSPTATRPATGTLTVTTAKAPPVNRAPRPQDDFADTGAGQPVTVDVLANDTDPDGDDLTLAAVVDGASTAPPSVVDGKVLYTPDEGWAGDDTVTYAVTDGDKSRHRHPHRHHRRRHPPVNRAPETQDDFADTGARPAGHRRRRSPTTPTPTATTSPSPPP